MWNEYASENGYEQIYDSVEEFAVNFEIDGVALARMVFFGDVRNWSDMVYLNGYGNFAGTLRTARSILMNWRNG